VLVEFWEWGFLYVLLLLAGAVGAYVIGRAGSLGYFRTRAEHLRQIIKELSGEDSNGKI
jgi:hypothetical protein